MSQFIYMSLHCVMIRYNIRLVVVPLFAEDGQLHHVQQRLRTILANMVVVIVGFCPSGKIIARLFATISVVDRGIVDGVSGRWHIEDCRQKE